MFEDGAGRPAVRCHGRRWVLQTHLGWGAALHFTLCQASKLAASPPPLTSRHGQGEQSRAVVIPDIWTGTCGEAEVVWGRGRELLDQGCRRNTQMTPATGATPNVEVGAQGRARNRARVY